MYLFSDQDMLIYDTDDFTQVDKWELSQPIEEGFGRLEFGSRDVLNDEPGFYTGAVQRQDPVQNRRIMGIGRVNLAAKSVDFYTLGPSTGSSFSLAPGRKVGLRPVRGHRPLRVLEVRSRAPQAAGRDRVQGPAAHGAEDQLERQGALHLQRRQHHRSVRRRRPIKYLRTITLDGDMTTELFVLPTPPARSRDATSCRPRRRSELASRDLTRSLICAARSASSSLLAAAGAGAGAEPRSAPRCRCICRCCPGTSSTAR